MTRARPSDLVAGGFVLILALINAVLLPRSLTVLIDGGPAVDWLQFVEGGQRVLGGDLYERTDSYGFRYSPVLAYLFIAIDGLGTTSWRLLHVAAALALPTWPMRLITLAAWPFWYDVETGNVMVFVLLAAAWALRGRSVAAGSFLLLMLLFPRPLMVPVAAWILWKHLPWRLPAAAVFFAHGIAVVASGWGPEWISLLLTLGAEEASPNNLGPTRWLGVWWLVAGVPLAVVLTLKGRLGWASLAVSYPYVLPYYLLMLVLEVPGRLGPISWSPRRAGQAR